MAIYHCSVKVIGRNAGRSAVAAAAYRSGEKLYNEYDGLEHDFTKKNWIIHKEILLTSSAPREYENRQALWNAVELAEKSKDAQLAREWEVALPRELTLKQQIDLVEQFARDNLVSEGMCVDIAIHNPPVTNDRHEPLDRWGHVTHDPSKMQFLNPHAHILGTVRPLDENGKWKPKSEIVYLCKRENEEQGFTAKEYQRAKEDGWQKQYRYYEHGKKVWYTASEGAERGLERVSRSPRTAPYGRQNSTVERWNHVDRIFEWRQAWEKSANQALKRAGVHEYIDCRSFAAQGRFDEIPSVHLGVSAINMERRAEREQKCGLLDAINYCDRSALNQEIQAYNQKVYSVLKQGIRIAKQHLESETRKQRRRGHHR